MVRQEIREADKLRRKPIVPEEDYTTARAEAADAIEDFVTTDEWAELTILELAERTAWSREHISTVLDLFFDPADAPEGIDTNEKPMGYRQGWRDCLEFVLEHPEYFGLQQTPSDSGRE